MKRWKLETVFVLGGVAVAMLLAAAPAEAASPAGKSYAGVLVMKDSGSGDVGVTRACLTFKKDGTFATNANDNGVWRFVEGSSRKRIESDLFLDFDGVIIPAVGNGVIERTGKGSSIGGTMLLDFFGQPVNVSFSGNQARRRACLAFAAPDN